MPKQKRVTLCSGEEVEIFDGDNGKDIRNICNWSKHGFIKPLKGNFILPKDFLEIDEKLYKFEFRSSDVFVNGFPKSGTTWVQEIVWTILYNLNLIHPMKACHTLFRSPFFETDSIKGVKGKDWVLNTICKMYNIPIKELFIDMYSDLPNPRIFKTHMYPSMINQKLLDVSKMVYVVRNPLDSCYSYYLYHRYMTGPFGLNKQWDEFPDVYIRGELFAGNAVEHVTKWWPYRENKRFYIVIYEDILRDPTGEIKKLAKFLEKDITEEEVQNVIQQTAFKTMKTNFSKSDDELGKKLGVSVSEEQSAFFRRGVAGDSKNMPKDAYQKLAEFFTISLKDYDLPYKYQ